MAATEIYFKTEYTDDQDLEIEGVKHKNSGNTKHIDYSELMEKLDQAKSITKEAVQICQTMFFENKGEVENGDQWFENIVEPLVQILDLFSSSINNYQSFLESQEKHIIHEGVETETKAASKNCQVLLHNIKSIKIEYLNWTDDYSCKFNRSGVFVKDSVESDSNDCNDLDDSNFEYNSEIDEDYVDNEQASESDNAYVDNEQASESDNDYVDNEQASESDYKNLAKKCLICKIKFKSFRIYDEHNWEIHQKRPFCDLCGKSFKKRQAVFQHQKFMGHRKIPIGWKPFKCEICDEAVLEKVSFNSFIEFFSHNWKVHQNDCRLSTKCCNCNICKKEFPSSKKLDEHKWEAHQIRPSCDICGQKFKNGKHIKKHKLLHNKSKYKKFSCDKCNVNFTSFKNLDKHNLDVHQLKPSCDICCKTFSSRSYKDKHNRELHSEHDPYQCHDCGKFFTMKNTLVKHRRLMHERRENEEKYSCEICGKNMITKQGFEQHKLTHIKREKSFLCNICGKGFFTPRLLKSHSRSHTDERPYSCELCEKKFKSKENLDKHIRIHTGEKPYSCDICGKAFNQDCDLRIHQRIHTGERPYSCDLCQKAFYSNSELSKHNKTSTHLSMLFEMDID